MSRNTDTVRYACAIERSTPQPYRAADAVIAVIAVAVLALITVGVI